jgi:hypothetical protein
MAHFKCEQCGRGIGSFSFHKELYTVETDDGDRNFCSEECAELWRQKDRAARLAKESNKPHPKPQKGNTDLTILYARKVKECSELYEAYAITGEDELLERGKELEKEIEELRAALGIKEGQDAGDSPLKWERKEWEREEQDDE